MQWSNFLRKVIRKVYPSYGLRNSDILAASFPKSGNTWLRFIWANMISLIELEGRNIDFEFLNTKLVAEYDSHTFGEIEYSCLPRLVKTHKQYHSAAFSDNRTIYIVRNPGDVAISFYEYCQAQEGHEVGDVSISAFIRDDSYGVPAWCSHVKSWRCATDVIVKYEHMKDDAERVIKKVLQNFNISTVGKDVMAEAVERSSFATLRGVEDSSDNVLPERFKSDYRFMRKGASGEWEERLNRNDISYVNKKLEMYGLNDLYRLAK